MSSIALLLVDLQEDYLARPGLTPDRAAVVSAAGELLRAFRAAGAPVAHCHTVVAPDGSDAMPHWSPSAPGAIDGRLMCVAGTPGVRPPAELAPASGELVAHKQFFTAFADPALEPWLRSRGVATVVIAGLYAHACVRETALAAYERGFTVIIARDALGTDSPAHASESLSWLVGRAARMFDTPTIVGMLESGVASADEVSVVEDVAARASLAQQTWVTTPIADRKTLLKAWHKDLEKNKQDFIDAIVADVHKPIALATDEVSRALGHIASAFDLPTVALEPFDISVGVTVAPRPLGVVGILMPWNNPLALPVGKLAPALLSGNGVVFKPAPEGERIARMTVDSLARAGMPAGLVGIVTGGPSVGMQVVHYPVVGGVAITGSTRAGRAVGAACVTLGKPIQAELGGNNAAIVLDDVDVPAVAAALVRNAFAYSGQRCTALRRFVVHAAIADEFIAAAIAEVNRLEIGGPADISTAVGPVISQGAAERILAAVRDAEHAGDEVLAGGTGFEVLGHSFVRPTLIRAASADSRIVQEETFGPVAVVQVAESLDHALELANGVAQGLIMGVCTGDEQALAYIAGRANVGVVSVGPRPVPVHPDAPFGGWKASGIGSPEHGIWDLNFYTRPQVQYRP